MLRAAKQQVKDIAVLKSEEIQSLGQF